MNIFEFENRIRKEFHDVNVIYKSQTGILTHKVIEGNREKNNITNDRWNCFSTIDEVKQSNLFKQNKTYPVIFVSINGTDCSNWEIEKI